MVRTFKALLRSTLSLLMGVLLIIGPLQVASAAPVDAKAEIENGLRSLGVFPKRRNLVKREVFRVCGGDQGAHGGTHCWNEFRDTPYTEDYSDFLHVQKLDVVKVGAISYGEPVLNTVPPNAHIKSFDGPNCTSTNQTIQTTLSLSVTTSKTISWSRTVTTGTTITVGIQHSQGFTYYGASGTDSFSGSVTVNKSIALTDGVTSQETETVSSSEAVNRTVPAMTEVYGSLRVMEGSVSIPFTAELVVDGPVDANLNNINRVSDLIDEKHRTFKAVGLIEATTASQARTSFYEKKLTAADCKSGSTFQLITFDDRLKSMADLQAEAVAELPSGQQLGTLLSTGPKVMAISHSPNSEDCTCSNCGANPMRTPKRSTAKASIPSTRPPN